MIRITVQIDKTRWGKSELHNFKKSLKEVVSQYDSFDHDMYETVTNESIAGRGDND